MCISTAVFMCTGYFISPVIKISLSRVSFFNVVFSKCKVAVNVTFVKYIKKVLRPFSSKHLFVALIKNRNLMPAFWKLYTYLISNAVCIKHSRFRQITSRHYAHCCGRSANRFKNVISFVLYSWAETIFHL